MRLMSAEISSSVKALVVMLVIIGAEQQSGL